MFGLSIEVTLTLIAAAIFFVGFFVGVMAEKRDHSTDVWGRTQKDIAKLGIMLEPILGNEAQRVARFLYRSGPSEFSKVLEKRRMEGNDV